MSIASTYCQISVVPLIPGSMRRARARASTKVRARVKPNAKASFFMSLAYIIGPPQGDRSEESYMKIDIYLIDEGPIAPTNDLN